MTIDDLKQKTTVNPRSDCWEWNGYKRNGYGRMTVGSRKDGTRRTESAHRVSYELSKGAIPIVDSEIYHPCVQTNCREIVMDEPVVVPAERREAT